MVTDTLLIILGSTSNPHDQLSHCRVLYNAETRRFIGKQRESVVVPENPADCQKRATFFGRLSSSIFILLHSAFQKMADTKKVKSPQDFMSAFLSFLVVVLHLTHSV